MRTINVNVVKLGIIAIYILLVTSPAFSKPRPPQPPWPEATLRIYGFDSAYQRGPWKDVAINEESSVADSWSGHSLVREGFVALSPVVIPVDVESKRPNFKLDGGAIRFWIAPNWSTADEKSYGKGPGHLARFVELVSLDASKPAVKWSLCVNESGDTIYLAGEGNTGTSIYLKAPVQFEAGDWRMITLGYSTTNTALWIDNELVAKGDGLPKTDWWETKNLGLVIGSDLYGSEDSVAEAQFDELTTLPRWPSKTKWDDMHFTAMKQRTLLGTLGTKEEEQTKVAVLKSAGLLPEEYGSMAKSSGEGDGPIILNSYAAGTLWLEITWVSNNLAHLIVHGTTADVAYEILSKQSLTNAEWVGEKVVIGATGQDWTPTTVTVGTRTNHLFFWARTLIDADGDGLPDWWELAHGLDPNNPDTGNTGVSDGYKDSDNDGWTNLQEYQNGTIPGQYNTPAPLHGFAVLTDATGTHAKLSWIPASGPVTGYTIERGSDNALISVSSSSRSHVDIQTNLPTGLYYFPYIPEYRIRAEYAGVSSEWSEWREVSELAVPTARMISKQSGGIQLMLPAIPAYVSSVRVGNASFAYPLMNPVSSTDIPVSQFTNGLVDLPQSFVLSATNNPYVRYVITNSAVSAINRDVDIQQFWDGRAQLKDNLRFLLRMPTPYERFSFVLRTPTGGDGWAFRYRPSPATYAFSDFFHIVDYGGTGTERDVYQVPSITQPFENNYIYKHLICYPTNLTSTGRPRTGVVWDGYMSLFLTNGFKFVPPLSGTTLPSLITTNDTRWTLYDNSFGSGQPTIYSWMISNPDNDLGVVATGTFLNWQLSMTGAAKNWFGLPYKSYLLTRTNYVNDMFLLTPTNSVPSSGTGYFYPEPAQPAFQLVDYQFTRMINDRIPTYPPMPGYSDFEPTNFPPSLFIISAAETAFTLVGYAKLAVTNGYPGVYGYLGQYFDKAYKTTNGVVTTNQTGILSPYGEFFPTEPGRTALVTMPDLDTGARGTAIVHVVKLQLDVNHDGVMDLNFAGPDNTSQSKPFTFWINNDRDEPSDLDKPDRDLSMDNKSPDYSYGRIRCPRNLEDFARLWICGTPTMSSNYQVTLSWNVSGGNPAINIYGSVESNGGIGYLTNFTTATAQCQTTPVSSGGYNYYFTGPGQMLGRIAADSAFTFAGNYFTNAGNRYLLFEGSGIGQGELVMTISQGTNVLAQTSAWLDLKDVKDLYERADAENVTSGFPPSSLVSQFKLGYSPSVAPDESKQIIVFVHGINNSEFAYQNTTETMFKRLYWSGYQGRVAGFRWPCSYLPNEGSVNPAEYLKALNFNKGEFYAWKSANAFKLYLQNITNRLAGYQINILAHSQGSVVASEALKQGAPFDNLILSQAAIPAHCYDTSTNVPFQQKFLTAETSTPTPFYQTNGGYHGYFQSLSGNIVNFFNPQDYALATGTYLGFEANWEKNHESRKPENFFLILGPTYSYSSSNGIAYRTDYSSQGNPTSPVSDLLEVKSLVARTRSKAIGAQAGVTGTVDSAFNLQTSVNFGTTRDEHSGQFTRDIQSVIGYYQALRIQIAP